MAVNNIAVSAHQLEAGEKVNTRKNTGSAIQLQAGSIIKGTVSGLGDAASIRIKDQLIPVSAQVVAGRNMGDTLTLKVADTTDDKITLKVMQQYVGAAGGNVLQNMTQLKVERSTDQFAAILKESDLSIDVVSDIMQQADSVARFSADDLKMLRRMGIDVNHADLSHLLGLVNQYHAQQEGRTFVTASAEVAQQIARAQNMDKISENTMAYMMQQNLPFTYENAYLAQYSSTTEPTEELEDTAWEELRLQVEDLFARQDIACTQEHMQAARFMLEHNCDITAENVTLYDQIQQFNQNGLDVQTYQKFLQAQQEATGSVKETPMAGESLAVVAKQLTESLAKVTGQAVDTVIEQNRPVTVGNVIAAQLELLQSGHTAPVENVQQDAATDEADSFRKEQWDNLQMIRLRLTVSAGYRLLQAGVDIPNLDLADMVQELKQLTSKEDAALFTDSKVSYQEDTSTVYERTMRMTQSIPMLPIYTLGQVPQSLKTVSLHMVYEEGIRFSGTLYQQDSKQNYETLGGYLASYEKNSTMVRTDLGDSLSGAFANMNSLLKEMHVADTKENRKAVRILAYNEMEITPDTIRNITTLDRNLMSVVKAMTPETVLGLIRDGIDPTTLSLSDLKQEIQKQQEKNGTTSEEKYSEFLYRLDKNQEITSQERDAYIGIYRLLHAVTSYSDRDLGAVIKNGQEITLSNLLSAHRSRKQTGSEVVIDDNFGMSEQIRNNAMSITDQIAPAFAGNSETAKEQTDDSTEEYWKTLAERTLDKLQIKENPSDMAAENVLEMTLEEWEEQLFSKESQEMGETPLQNWKELSSLNRKEVEWLQSLDMPVTPGNLLAMQQLTEHTAEFYQNIQRVLDRETGQKGEKERAFSQLEERLLSVLDNQTEETMDAPAKRRQQTETDMEQAYAVFSRNIDRIFYGDGAATITARDLSYMKQIHTSLKAVQQMGRQKQYLIPVATENEILTMQVTVNSGSGQGCLKASVPTVQYGTVQVQMQVTHTTTSITFGCDTDAGKMILQGQEQAISRQLQQTGILPDGLHIAITDAKTDFLLEPQPEQEQEQRESGISNRSLYQCAKGFVQFIRNMDKAGLGF